MTTVKYIASIAALTLVFSLGAFAGSSNSGKFDLLQPARVGTTVLQPGHYTAEWNGPNDSLQVTILNHGKTVATAHGHLKEMPNKSPYNAVSVNTRHENPPQVDEIDFDNRSESLMLAGA